MRVAMLSWESPWSFRVGDVSVHVHGLTGALVAMGHEVHVFTRRAPGQEPLELVDGVFVHRCAHERRSDFVDDVEAMCESMVAAVLAEEDRTRRVFDVVHAQEWLTVGAMVRIKQARGRRSVLTVHTTEHARGGGSERICEHERVGGYWADAVLALSVGTAGEMLRLYDVPAWKLRVIEADLADPRTRGVAALLEWHAIGVDTLEAYDPGRTARILPAPLPLRSVVSPRRPSAPQPRDAPDRVVEPKPAARITPPPASSPDRSAPSPSGTPRAETRR